jgi:hypothetical protein
MSESQVPVEQTLSGSANEDQETEPKTTDTVAYETDKKAVNERKRDLERLRETESKLNEVLGTLKQREEEELRKKEDYKKLLELKAEEANTFKSKYETMMEERRTASKLTALLEVLPGKVDKKYWDKLPYDQIIQDDESGEIDELSLAKARDLFVAEYPEIIRTAKGPELPSKSPQSAASTEESKDDKIKRLIQMGVF